MESEEVAPLMSPILFYFFAALTLVFGVAVVANRNPGGQRALSGGFVHGLAALFVGLDAYFIAVIRCWSMRAR